MERFAAIDFETANGKRSSICSIGIAIIEDNKVVDSIYTLVRPYPNFYTRFTTAVHGITMQDTIGSPDFEEAWAGIAGKLRDIPLVAHNSPFDEGCLRAAHEAYDLAYPKYQFIVPAVCQGVCILFWSTINYKLLPPIADTI